MDTHSIGMKIRQRRTELNMMQEQLAERVEISSTFMGLIERGEKAPSLETFVNIANALYTPADFLLEDILKIGYQIKLSRYTERMEKIPPEERLRICDVIETMLTRAENDIKNK